MFMEIFATPLRVFMLQKFAVYIPQLLSMGKLSK